MKLSALRKWCGRPSRRSQWGEPMTFGEEENASAILREVELFERKRRRRTVLYTAVPFIAMLILVGATTLSVLRLQGKAQALQGEVKRGEEEKAQLDKELQTIRDKLQAARAASEYLRMGLNSFHEKNYPEAIDSYNRALDLDPENPVLYDLRGYAQFRAGKTAEAIASLRRSVELMPDYTWGHYNLALAYWKDGNQEAAVDEVEKLLRIDSSFRQTIVGDGQFNVFRQSPRFRALIW